MKREPSREADAEGDSRGIVTLAVGHRRYLEMAVDMALSYHEHDRRDVVLVADAGIAQIARSEYGSIFGDVVVLAPRFREGRAVKFGVVEASPFDRALYVDADCLIVGSLEEYWAELERFDVALVGELLGIEDERTHHGFSTGALMRQLEAHAYLI